MFPSLDIGLPINSFLILSQPDDFVIATGLSCSLQEFVEAAFEHVGLDTRQHAKVDKGLFRPNEIGKGRRDASKAAKILKWQAKTKMPEVAKLLVDECVNELGRTGTGRLSAPQSSIRP